VAFDRPREVTAHHLAGWAGVQTRQSSERQTRENRWSLEYQRAQARWPRLWGWSDEEIKFYEEPGLSGTAIEHRPEFLRMIEDIKARRLRAVFCADQRTATASSNATSRESLHPLGRRRRSIRSPSQLHWRWIGTGAEPFSTICYLCCSGADRVHDHGVKNHGSPRFCEITTRCRHTAAHRRFSCAAHSQRRQFHLEQELAILRNQVRKPSPPRTRFTLADGHWPA